MKVHVQHHGRVTLLTPHGPLIGDETADLRRSLTTATAARTGRVVVDCADVPYLDSIGIELLLELCGAQVEARQRPKLAALSEACRDALDLTNVLPALEVSDTVENALRSCQQ